MASVTSLVRVPDDPAEQPRWWPPEVTSLAVEGSTLYYTGNGGAYSEGETEGGSWTGVYKVDKCGGTPILLATGKYPQSIAADETDVYWLDGTSVYRESSGGGTVNVIVNDASEEPFTVVLDSGNVYWNSEHFATGDTFATIFGRAKGGGPVVTLMTSRDVQSLWSDGTSVYAWAVPKGAGTAMSLYRVSMPGPPTLITSASELTAACAGEYPGSNSDVSDWCVSGFAHFDPGGGQSVSRPLTGVAGIAADSTHLYYLTRGTSSPSSYCPRPDAELVSLNIPNRQKTTLASGLAAQDCGNLGPIVFDDHNLYFATEAGIFAVSKP
jgi:hypothetical protein